MTKVLIQTVELDANSMGNIQQNSLPEILQPAAGEENLRFLGDLDNRNTHAVMSLENFLLN